MAAALSVSMLFPVCSACDDVWYVYECSLYIVVCDCAFECVHEKMSVMVCSV